MVGHVGEIAAMMRVLEHQDWGNLSIFQQRVKGQLGQERGHFGRLRCVSPSAPLPPL